ncbi:leishmanolysin-related zinc metalloendopeptidase [Longimicrobium sp.]|uniref:leishmanolysin-related zinc metalloendopeptidase n=1 Tax=Longimicrobium sp. TaxID=2029185 RepID=UPI002CA087E8|nr:leishmanolysin-related zinc metalloendopeptidase [Longimicrobium sp.]HSU17598.1 leishmanolysin-related zinc metalloendopeptidase [Longimicrobium sp.]
MTRLRFTCCAAATILAVSACVNDAARPTLPSPPEQPKAPPMPLGMVQITVSGIGTSQMSGSITPVASRAGGPRASLTVANGIVFEPLTVQTWTEGTRTAGGQRYVTATYRIRNQTGTALNNVTLLMASRPNTISGTPISSLKRFDGTDAAPSIATSVVPTGAISIKSDLVTMLALYPDVLQVLTEAEVAAIPPTGDITSVFPYGYMVRNWDPAATHRQLPVPTSVNQYDGVVTVSFRMPLQATATQDVFTLTFQALVVQDSETRLTESIEEGQDTAAVRRLRERAAALGATTVTVLAGSTAPAADVADYPGQRQICTVRTAGTAAAPVTFITAPGAYSRVEMLRPGESSSACGPSFRSGTPSFPSVGSPYAITIKSMDRYGNKLTQPDTFNLTQTSGPPAAFGAQAALSAGQTSISVTWNGIGTSLLNAVGRRLRGQRSIDVAVPATVTISAGDNQAAMAGSAVPTAPAVLVRDASNAPLAGVPVTFSVSGGGGSVTSATTTTDGSGIARVGSWVLGSPATMNTLSATALGGASAVTFKASGCSGGGGIGFGITLCYTSAMSAVQRAAFDSAAAKWSRVITGDVPDLAYTLGTGSCGTGSPSFNLSIDDLMIFATVEPIDGAGAVLGQAGPCFVRSAEFLPFVGRMRFDSADMPSMEASGMLSAVILHEMGHVLGIGSLWQPHFSLVQNASPVGGPPLDTYYSGTNGIAGFNSIGGSTYTGGNKVPVENTGSSGTINVHWRESVLANELMTGYANAGPMPLSLLTVRSLQDFGYTVNTGAADAFFLTLSARQGPAPGAIPLGNDVMDLPLTSVDRQGRATRIR